MVPAQVPFTRQNRLLSLVICAALHVQRELFAEVDVRALLVRARLFVLGWRFGNTSPPSTAAHNRGRLSFDS